MISIRYRTILDETEKEVLLSYEDFYDIPDEGETLPDDGVEKYLDPRNYLKIEKSIICKIVVVAPVCSTEIHYGKQGSLTQHTRYEDGSEMLVVQSHINEHIVHHVKMTKEKESGWCTTELDLIDDVTGKISSIK